MVIKNKAPGGLPPGARVSVSHSLKNTHFQAAILLIFLAHSAIFVVFFIICLKIPQLHPYCRHTLMWCCGGLDANHTNLLMNLNDSLMFHPHFLM